MVCDTMLYRLELRISLFIILNLCHYFALRMECFKWCIIYTNGVHHVPIAPPSFSMTHAEKLSLGTGEIIVHWNVARNGLPVSATFVCVLDRWLIDWDQATNGVHMYMYIHQANYITFHVVNLNHTVLRYLTI